MFHASFHYNNSPFHTSFHNNDPSFHTAVDRNNTASTQMTHPSISASTTVTHPSTPAYTRMTHPSTPAFAQILTLPYMRPRPLQKASLGLGFNRVSLGIFYVEDMPIFVCFWSPTYFAHFPEQHNDTTTIIWRTAENK